MKPGSLYLYRLDDTKERPNPQDEATFRSTKLNHSLKQGKRHKVLRDYHKELIRLRKEVTALANLSREDMEVSGYPEVDSMSVRRWRDSSQVCLLFNFSENSVEISLPPTGELWAKILCSADEKWGGIGSQASTEVNTLADNSIKLNPYSVEIYQSSHYKTTPRKIA